MKITGAELKAFYEAWPWGKDFFHDEYDPNVFPDDGEMVIELGETYDLEGTLGVVLWQGSDPEPESINLFGSSVRYDHGLDVAKAFKLWKATQGGTQLVRVSLPVADVNKLLKLAAKHGWAVVV